MVEDFVIVGTRKEVENFIDKFSKRFKIGRFNIDEQVVFNGIRIKRDEKGSIKNDMEE